MTYGQGKFTYEVVEGWAKLPAGESFVDVAGVCTDPQGRVYVLSRSAFPISVFDRDGHLLSRWGKGLFQRAHVRGDAPHLLNLSGKAEFWNGGCISCIPGLDCTARCLASRGSMGRMPCTT
jgi:hypothetical protein